MPPTVFDPRTAQPVAKKHDNVLPFLLFLYSLGYRFPTTFPPELSFHSLFRHSSCMFCSPWHFWLNYPERQCDQSAYSFVSSSLSQYTCIFFSGPQQISLWSFLTLPTPSLVSSLTKSALRLSPGYRMWYYSLQILFLLLCLNSMSYSISSTSRFWRIFSFRIWSLADILANWSKNLICDASVSLSTCNIYCCLCYLLLEP